MSGGADGSLVINHPMSEVLRGGALVCYDEGNRMIENPWMRPLGTNTEISAPVTGCAFMLAKGKQPERFTAPRQTYAAPIQGSVAQELRESIVVEESFSHQFKLRIESVISSLVVFMMWAVVLMVLAKLGASVLRSIRKELSK